MAVSRGRHSPLHLMRASFFDESHLYPSDPGSGFDRFPAHGIASIVRRVMPDRVLTVRPARHARRNPHSVSLCGSTRCRTTLVCSSTGKNDLDAALVKLPCLKNQPNKAMVTPVKPMPRQNCDRAWAILHAFKASSHARASTVPRHFLRENERKREGKWRGP